MAEKNEKEKAVNEQIRDFGQVELEHGEDRISMLTIIGEIEGHECLPAATKTSVTWQRSAIFCVLSAASFAYGNRLRICSSLFTKNCPPS